MKTIFESLSPRKSLIKCLFCQTTSSESTSSTSSGSSSSSSSSSGSESSSSDSENTSSSALSQKASDSDRVKKKVPLSAARHVKSKTETNPPPVEVKGKEKVVPKSRLVYSSESEGSPVKGKPSPAKRKPPAKPKATATVAPVVKQQKPPSKPNASSTSGAQQKNTLTCKPVNKLNKFPGWPLIIQYHDIIVAIWFFLH